MRSKWQTSLSLAVALMLPALPFLLIGELPGERWLSHADDNAFVFGLTGSALLAGDVLLPVPSSIVGTLLGGRLGFLAGWCWAWAGMGVGNLLGYLVGRAFPAPLRPRLAEAPTLAALFASRPVPVLAEGLTLACGAARMPFWRFLGAIGAGNAIYAAALAGSGTALLTHPATGASVLLVLLLTGGAWFAWSRHRAKHAAGEPMSHGPDSV